MQIRTRSATPTKFHTSTDQIDLSFIPNIKILLSLLYRQAEQCEQRSTGSPLYSKTKSSDHGVLSLFCRDPQQPDITRWKVHSTTDHKAVTAVCLGYDAAATNATNLPFVTHSIPEKGILIVVIFIAKLDGCYNCSVGLAEALPTKHRLH